jgi:flagellar biosynthesis GTPase FlhF
MNLQTFKAATMAEALTQVKSNMGSDAVILHTRTFYTRHWLGLRRREMVEITAGKGLNVGRRRFVSGLRLLFHWPFPALPLDHRP